MKYNEHFEKSAAPLQALTPLASTFTFAGRLRAVEQTKSFDVEDGADPLPLWFDDHFNRRANGDLVRASDIEEIMKQHRAGAIQLHQCHCLRAAQRLAVAVDVTKGIADKPAGGLDFHLFGECAEAAFAKYTCWQVNLLARSATGGDQFAALLQGVKKYLSGNTCRIR
jgi:hypothetical protein